MAGAKPGETSEIIMHTHTYASPAKWWEPENREAIERATGSSRRHDARFATLTRRDGYVTVSNSRPELICGSAMIKLLLGLSVISCAEHRADAVAM